MEKIEMASPWVQYVNALTAMFDQDPNIKIIYNEDVNEVKLLVTGTDKANALEALLPRKKEFGNVTLHITVVPANLKATKSVLIQQALEGNPAFAYSETYQGPMSNPMTFVVFNKEVVQYYNDNLGDIHGLRSTLYETLANEIFEDHEGVFFCTDVDEDEIEVEVEKE